MITKGMGLNQRLITKGMGLLIKVREVIRDIIKFTSKITKEVFFK